MEGVSLFVGPDADGVSNSSMVRAVRGCTVGEVGSRPNGIRSVWLAFERPCRAGETALLQVEVMDVGPFTLAETEYGLVAEQRLEESVLWVRFDPEDVPRRCWASYEEGEVSDEWEVELAGSSAVHHRQTAFGPGTSRIRWEW